MRVYFRLIKESFGFAVNALRTNKLRTFLSLLGVTIGIFSIIAVLAAVDSLDRKFKKDLSALDKNTIFLCKYSFGPTDIPEWKRDQFPQVTYREYEYLSNNLSEAKSLAFQYFAGTQNVKYNDKTVSSANMVPVSSSYQEVQVMEFSAGRFYNESESNSGAAVAVLGDEIAKSLFEDIDPVGKEIRLYGQRFKIIGVLKKQGKSMFGPSDDTCIYIPANFLRNRYGDHNEMYTPTVVIKPNKGIDIDAFKQDISIKIKTIRGMKPSDEDNFFINILSGFTVMIDQLISALNIGGWIIAAFSLLVGGFGIANIMFVSVKERTNLIGIQKSLGAKNKFILFQFLFEAIILCLIGGFIGLFMVWLIAFGLSKALDFEFVLSFSNILLGSGLAIIIGLISGIIPAVQASKLDPVEAIRSGM